MINQCFLYVLKSESFQRTYVGISLDPKKRLIEHNAGKTKSTKRFTPWEIVHTEKFNSRSAARKREIFLKSGAGREWIKRHFFLEKS